MSKNVFADIGLPNPEEHSVKARIVSKIGDVIQDRELTQVEAGRLMGIDQPKVSALLKGQFSGYSLDRLLRFLNLLDMDVEIVVRKKDDNRDLAETHVMV